MKNEVEEIHTEFEQMFNRLAQEGNHHVIVLNAYAELEANKVPEDRLEEFSLFAHENASTKCSWIVSLVHPGEKFSSEHTAELEEAVESRKYFYTEREKEYGPTAWPLQRQTAAAAQL